MKKIYFILVIFSVFISFGAEAFTLAYNSRNNYYYKAWITHHVQYDYNFSDCSLPADQMAESVKAAVEVWNGVPSSSLSVSVGNEVTTSLADAIAPNAPGNPIIICDSHFSADFRLDGDLVPVAAGITYLDDSQHISSGVIILNSESGKINDIAKLMPAKRAIAIGHSVGYILGLGLSSDKHALMYYTLTSKTEVSLAKDDMDGITYLYPRNELGGSGVFGCNTVQMIPPVGGGPNSGFRKNSSVPLSGDSAPAVDFSIALLALYLIRKGLPGALSFAKKSFCSL